MKNNDRVNKYNTFRWFALTAVNLGVLFNYFSALINCNLQESQTDVSRQNIDSVRGKIEQYPERKE